MIIKAVMSNSDSDDSEIEESNDNKKKKKSQHNEIPEDFTTSRIASNQNEDYVTLCPSCNKKFYSADEYWHHGCIN